jgi:hypothetical protein
MRIIVKPFGAAFVLGSGLVLSLLALRGTPLNVFPTAHAHVSLSGPSLLPDISTWNLVRPMEADAKKSLLPVTGQTFDKALHLTVNTVPKDPWNIQISDTSSGPIRKDDVLMVTFYGHAVSGPGKVAFAVEQNAEPFEKAFTKEIVLHRHWSLFRVPFRSLHDLNTDQVGVNFQLGYAKQTIELADVQLINYRNTASLDDLQASVDASEKE